MTLQNMLPAFIAVIVQSKLIKLWFFKSLTSHYIWVLVPWHWVLVLWHSIPLTWFNINKTIFVCHEIVKLCAVLCGRLIETEKQIFGQAHVYILLCIVHPSFIYNVYQTQNTYQPLYATTGGLFYTAWHLHNTK